MAAKRTLAENIQQAMDVRGLTQSELSRMTGVSTAVLSLILMGKTKDPRFGTVLAIAKALGVSLEYLARGCDLK